VAFEPNVGQRRYAEIADQLSVPALHLFGLLRELKDAEPITSPRIAQCVAAAGHDWTADQIASYLAELRCAGFIRIVRQGQERPHASGI
jgi:hypothetical protein